MINYYVKIAFKNFWRNKQFSVFNVIGLGIGIACCILIFLFIYDDIGYDRFHQKTRDIYRLITETNLNGQIKYGIGLPAPLKTALKEEIPEIENVIRLAKPQNYATILYQNKELRDQELLYADPEIFETFDFKFIKGNVDEFEKNPLSVVITRSFAKKIFGNEEPIGKVLSIKENSLSNFIVCGVIDNIPTKSSIKFDCLFSFNLIKENRWNIRNFETFVLLKKNTGPDVFTSKLKYIETKYFNQQENKVKLHIQPLTKIRLDLNPFNQYPTAKNNVTVFIFSLIGLIILLIAIFNYIILSTANTFKRLISVGLQKNIGATRKQLIIQYLSESILITIFAGFLAIILADSCLPYLNRLSGKDLLIDYKSGSFYIILFAGSVMLGIVSGLYPALFLTSLKPAAALKKEIIIGYNHKKLNFRELLVISQLVISITLVICSITIKKQSGFIKNKNIGIDYSHVLVLPIQQKEIKEKYSLLVEKLLKNPNIIGASATSYLPGKFGYCQSTWWECMPLGETNMLDWISVDPNFIKALKIKILKGNDFSDENKNFNPYILNKTAYDMIGWDNPIGKKIDIIGEGTVVGVVDDFNFNSLHVPVKPVALCIYPESYEYLYIKIVPKNITSSVQTVQNEWKRLFPHKEFSYSFLENAIESNYIAEIRTGITIDFFTFLTIILSCLGLYSLVSYAIQQRTKEIGIRKVNGARVTEVIAMLNANMIKLVMIAVVMSCPIAWFAMNKWLHNFAYKTELSWWIYAVAGSLAVAVALITVSWQSWKAATRNPVEALRYE